MSVVGIATSCSLHPRITA